MATTVTEEARETVDLLRGIGGIIDLKAADVIERLLDRINHLTNVNDGLRETITDLRMDEAEKGA